MLVQPIAQRPGMVRVSLKNTFLSFDGIEEEPDLRDERPPRAHRQAASPRSRSAECMSPNRVPEEVNGAQIEKLNRLLVTEPLPSSALEPSTSPALGPASSGSLATGLDLLEGLSMPPSGAATPTTQGRAAAVSGTAAFSSAPSSSSCQAPLPPQLPLPFGSEGPSAQELLHLHRRLEEACQASHRTSEEGGRASASSAGAFGCKVRHVASAGSLSTMTADSSDEEVCVKAHSTPPRSPPVMFQVRSSNSICSLASEQGENCGEHGETVAFDMTIEDNGPLAQRWSDASESPRHAEQLNVPWVRQREPAAAVSSAASSSAPNDPRVLFQPPFRRGRCGSGGSSAAGGGSGRGSGRGSSGSASPGSASPGRGSVREGEWRSSDRPQHRQCSPPMSPKGGGRFSQWRPLPKEYRHGHVPKNLNLAEEYRNAAPSSPPTTLMIRNIPNRYTQRELIMELEDLGFAGTFDFLYIPLDKGTMSNVGYAFVNFTEPSWAQKCMASFQNYRFKRHRKISGKIAAISVAHIQGLEANLAHYENAAVNTAKLKQRRPVLMANISGALLDDN